MAASVGIPHPDLPEAPTSPGQKRKRASESASPDSRRKRGAPAGPAPAPAPAVSNPESDSQTFLGDPVSIAQAAHDHVSVDDFSALAQATVSEHPDATDASNASNTAAAALNMYPSLHVPQSTEETFANQSTPESHHSENSFNNHAASQPSTDGLPLPPPASAQQTPNGAQQEQRYSAPPNAKPAVGSEEWHKMRKDNHKEGKLHSLIPLETFLTAC
jgi:bHLH factor